MDTTNEAPTGTVYIKQADGSLRPLAFSEATASCIALILEARRLELTEPELRVLADLLRLPR